METNKQPLFGNIQAGSHFLIVMGTSPHYLLKAVTSFNIYEKLGAGELYRDDDIQKYNAELIEPGDDLSADEVAALPTYGGVDIPSLEDVEALADTGVDFSKYLNPMQIQLMCIILRGQQPSTVVDSINRLVARGRSDEQIGQSLVNTFIVPYNTANVLRRQDASVEKDGFFIWSVHDDIPFAYAVMRKDFDFEIMGRAGLGTSVGTILHQLCEQVVVEGIDKYLEEVFTLAFHLEGGGPCRFKLVECPEPEEVTKKLCLGWKRPETTKYCLLYPDHKNRLPDEDGYDDTVLKQLVPIE